jgi:hypothetical protein
VSVRVTVEDLVDGHTEQVTVAEGDYFIVTTEPCYVDGVQTYPTKGTHVLTIKGCRPKAVTTTAPAADTDAGQGDGSKGS